MPFVEYFIRKLPCRCSLSRLLTTTLVSTIVFSSLLHSIEKIIVYPFADVFISDMIVLRRQTQFFLGEIRRTLIADRIPQYKERSALLPGGIDTPFPIVVEPDIDLELLFKSREQLQENLQRRHWIVDVKKVEQDYHRWKTLSKQIADASARQSEVGRSDSETLSR